MSKVASRDWADNLMRGADRDRGWACIYIGYTHGGTGVRGELTGDMEELLVFRIYDFYTNF